MAMNTPLGGRDRRSRRSRRLMSEINVTPMVDVMLVLLIVFMVAAPMLTVGIPLDLPETEGAAPLNYTAQDPIIISVDDQGKVFLSDTEIATNKLVDKLRAVTENNANTRIFVRGDSKINYGAVVQVVDIVTTAGFTRATLVTK